MISHVQLHYRLLTGSLPPSLPPLQESDHSSAITNLESLLAGEGRDSSADSRDNNHNTCCPSPGS